MAELTLAHTKRPVYGSRRLAIHLGWSRGKARHLMRLAGIIFKKTKGKPGCIPGKAAHPAPANTLSLYDEPTTKGA